jgi:uncharacterized protein (TIGR02996 family)
MREDAAFLEAIAADPADEAVRAVYADWLEERGDVRAECLRLEEEQHALEPARLLTGERLDRYRRIRRRLDELLQQVPGGYDWWCSLDRGLQIPEPLLGLMWGSATCDPGCCGFEAYSPEEPALTHWVPQAGPEKARQALQAVDVLLARVVESGIPLGTRRLSGGRSLELGVTAEHSALLLREYKRLLEPLLRPHEPVRR